MAIGTALAILGSAAVGAYASNKAAGKAADAATTAADKNAQVARDIYDQNKQLFSPLITGSYPALGQLQSRLGLTGPSSGISTAFGQPAASATPTAFQNVDWAAYEAANPDIAQRAAEGEAEGAFGPGKQWANKYEWMAWHNGTPGEGRPLPMSSAPNDAIEGEYRAYGEPDGLEMPTFGPRSNATRPTMDPLDLGIDKYRKSAGYDYRVKEAGRGVNSNYAAAGLLQSGAAATAFGQKMQDLADQDYYDWADRERAQWNTDRSVLNQNFDIDTARADARYDSDRGFTYGRAIDDRNYATSRFDKETSDLFGLLGIGTSAAGALSGAGANYGSAVMGSNTQAANATGSAAIAGANSVNNLLGQGLSAFGMFKGNGQTAFGTPTYTPAGSAPAANTNYGYTGGNMRGLY